MNPQNAIQPVESNLQSQPTKLLGGVTGKGFLPGKSGNPGGRPKGLASRIRKMTNEHWCTVITVAIHSGLRDSELRDLKWADVRLAERWIFVRNTKSKRDRVVDLSETLFETLRLIPRHISSPYVFTNPSTGTKYTNPFTTTAGRRC